MYINLFFITIDNLICHFSDDAYNQEDYKYE